MQIALSVIIVDCHPDYDWELEAHSIKLNHG